MLNLATGKNDLAPVALTRRDFGKGLAAILAAGCAPAIASAAARGAGGRVRGAAAAAAAATYDYYDGVEYLENVKDDTNLRIFTGVYPSQTVGLKLITDVLEITYDRGNLMGSTTTSLFAGGKSIALYLGTTGSITAPFGGSETYSLSSSLTLGVDATISLNYKQDGLVKVLQGGDYKCNTAITTTYSDYETEIALFVLPTSDSTFYSGAARQRMKRCEISIGGEMVRCFVPVLHEGEGKMLDLCHNKLYSNAGTGSFIVGPRTGVIQVPKQGVGANTPSI